MKLLRQFLIILAISFVGEALKYLLPLPVPASIYGMVILFVGDRKSTRLNSSHAT